MTIMIPNNCVDICPIAQVLYRNLGLQLGSTDRVVQHLAPKTGLSGSLLWVQHQRQSLFIYLANSTEGNITLDNIDLKNVDNIEIDILLENREVSQLLALQQQFLPKTLYSHRSKLAPFLIINPYIGNTHNHLALKSLGLYFSGKELIKSNTLGTLVYKLLGIASSELLYQHIRRVFNPELIITIDGKNINSSKTKILAMATCLLDESQEAAVKTDIVLHSRNYRSENYNLTGVSGCVASGKTETLFQRVKLIKQFKSDSKVVIITANCASQARLRKRDNMINGDKLTEIFSFNEWSKQQLKPPEHIVDNTELANTIESLLKEHLEENGISQFIFLRELDFIYGRKIFYENDYLSTKNVARTYNLSSVQFSHIWRSVLTLKNEFFQKNWLLPARIPQLLWDRLQEKPVSADYDHILVDDAHLLPPIAFELFKKLIKPESGQIFITQNPNQGIINPNQLWEDTKLDLHGHNICLASSYQINFQIINASKAFFQNRLLDDHSQNILDVVKESQEACLPRLLHFYFEMDEQNRLLNEVKNHIYNGCNPQEILIICNDNEIAQLAKLISESLNVSVDWLNDFHFNSYKEREGVGICNFLQAQGLKASYVFIFGLKQLFESERKAEKAGTTQYQAKRVENTRLIAMAMTRARKDLTLFISAKEIPQAFITPYIKIPTSSNESKEKIISVVSYLRKSG